MDFTKHDSHQDDSVDNKSSVQSDFFMAKTGWEKIFIWCIMLHYAAINDGPKNTKYKSYLFLPVKSEYAIKNRCYYSEFQSCTPCDPQGVGVGMGKHWYQWVVFLNI